MKSSELKKIEDMILAMIRDSKAKRLSRAVIRKRLTKAGYKLSDVEQVLNRILPSKRGLRRCVGGGFPRVRVAAFYIPDGERHRYSREAYGALMRLHSYQILDLEDWKVLLDRLMRSSGKVYLGKVLEVLEEIVVNRYPMEQVKVIYDVALGSKSMYQ